MYIGLSCIPFELVKIDAIFIKLFHILAQILIFVFTGLVFRKSSLKLETKTHNSKNILYFLPAFLICFSNFFTLFDPNNSLTFSFDFVLILQIVFSILVAFNEEIIFRALLLGNLYEDKKPLVRIVIAAGIFAACHLTHFISTFDPSELVVVAYSFGIGLVLGMMYLYTGSLTLGFVFHALYNIVNNDLANEWISYNNGFTSFYTINILVALVGIAYLFGIYYYKFREIKS
ncbi:MAG: CPBP family intramembrane metalloprotease [Bacilli bacterium]|nr:CPBP family intramembrane metalloprotease [Bacilli bacterium]